MKMKRVKNQRQMARQAVSLVLASLLVCLSVLLSGCGESEPVIYVDLSKREEVMAPHITEAITYAYLPQYSHSISYQRHRALLRYLRETTGLPLRQIFPDTFDEHIAMVERGEIDISFSNPFVYVKLAQSGATAFARILEPSGMPHFQGQIICRTDNPTIKDLEDCRGKRWIAVDPGSAGGYLFPLGLFYDNGLTVDDFEMIDFAPGPGGKQEKVVLAVNAGAYDLGTIRKGTLDVVAGKVDLANIRVLAETHPFPGWVYSARKGMDEDIVRTIAMAMYELKKVDPDDWAILKSAGMRGIIPAQDADYDSVRDLARKLGLE